MRHILLFLSTLLLWFPAAAAPAVHTQAQLLVGAASARPGETVLAGVRLQMDPGWHTYWKNPGASGTATSIEWQLPRGVTAGEVQWPLPQKLTEEEFTTYIYTNEVVLLVPLKLAADVPPGPLELKAKVAWLECAMLCVPGSANVQATLTVGPKTKASSDASLLETWSKRVPQAGTALAAHAWWENAGNTNGRPLLLEWKANAAVSEPDFYPYSSEQFEIQGPTERLPADAGLVRIRKQVKKFEGDWPKEISGVVLQRTGTGLAAYQVSCPVGGAGPAPVAGVRTAAVPGPGPAPRSLWEMLLYAFCGGLILNIMPCVLPVIALKILGFVRQAGEDPRRVRLLGLVYALGVMISFAVLAGMVIAVQAAGHKAGWGMQFNNPYFLVVMTTLLTLIALNLFGVFEVHLGSRAMDAASSLSSKHGVAGAFFNGLLATVLATSCTAPLLGPAIGFAFAQSPAVILLVLCTVGLGLAAPYVVLSWEPQWLKFLPKPGPWMERFKVAMGFPMLAAAVWVFNLVTDFYGDRSWWLGIFLVTVAVAAWIYGEFIQRQPSRPALAMLMVVGALGAGYGAILEGQMHWRAPIQPTSAATAPAPAHDGVAWQPWSPATLARVRTENRPVLVDFTAKWCLTCNTLIKPVLESASVRQKIQQINAVALLGDYTHYPPEITTELNRYGRAGVPLVLVYPKNPAEPPQVLPEALTPGMVVEALDRAAR